MKKYIFFIICILSIFSDTNAFFGGGYELDLYKNIDEGVGELEDKMLIYEANGGLKKTGILKEINELATTKDEKACLDDGKSISEQDFEDIANKGNIEKLSNYISEDCKKNNSFSTTTLKNYSAYFRKHYDDSKKTAESKSQKIYDISKIGLFSDGIVENSGFDLITDIEDIDKIIFASKTDYYGEQNVDLGESINGLLSSVKDAGYDVMNYGKGSDLYPTEYKPTKYKPTLYNTKKNNEKNLDVNETENLYICPIDKNKSGLSDSNLNYIYTDINKIKLKKENDTILNNESVVFNYPTYQNDNTSVFDESSSNKYSSNSIGGYSKIRDNSQWPCESFFCINIDFVMYEHNLFGGSDNITIEYLLNRSNEHLGKYAATSLIPAKMSTNLFEIGLKDLNLPDIFHMAMQVSTKPIPILRLEKQGKEDESEFASKNLLEKYYDLNGLNYERRNDLVLVKSKEQEKESILASQELTTGNASEKMDEYNDYMNKQNEKIRIVEKAIEKKVSNGVLGTFEEQYTELDKFTYSIYNYVEDLHTIITKMKEIPIDKG